MEKHKLSLLGFSVPIFLRTVPVSNVWSGYSGECSPVTNNVSQVVCLDSMLLVSSFLIQENSLPEIDLLNYFYLCCVYLCFAAATVLLHCGCIYVCVYVCVHVLGGVLKAA